MEISNLLKIPGVTSSLGSVVYSVVEISEKAEEGGVRHRPNFRYHFSSISCFLALRTPMSSVLATADPVWIHVPLVPHLLCEEARAPAGGCKFHSRSHMPKSQAFQCIRHYAILPL